MSKSFDIFKQGKILQCFCIYFFSSEKTMIENKCYDFNELISFAKIGEITTLIKPILFCWYKKLNGKALPLEIYNQLGGLQGLYRITRL